MRYLSVLFLLFLSSCGKYYLSVQQQWVDINYLASVQVDTPDPRKEHPPLGQMLIIDWLVPARIMQQEPQVVLDVIYWDYTKERICLPMQRQMDYTIFELFNALYEKTGGILTYKAQIVTKHGEKFKESKHQLWTELITIDEE